MTEQVHNITDLKTSSTRKKIVKGVATGLAVVATAFLVHSKVAWKSSESGAETPSA